MYPPRYVESNLRTPLPTPYYHPLYLLKSYLPALVGASRVNPLYRVRQMAQLPQPLIDPKLCLRGERNIFDLAAVETAGAGFRVPTGIRTRG